MSGGTPSTSEPSYWGDEINWISPSDLTGYRSKFISKGAKSITAAGLKNSSARLMPAGSVHFSSRAPIGYTVISAQSLCTNQGFKSVVPADGVFNEYLFHYLKFIRQEANARATGTTFKELSGSAFAALPFPLAPLAEQRRIVEKVEELFSELDEGVANLKQARAQLAVYRQALLKHAFEGHLTADWRTKHAAELESADQLLDRIRAEMEERYQKQLKEWEKAMEKWEAGDRKDSKPSKPRTPPLAELPSKEELSQLPVLPTGWNWMRLGSCNVDVFDGPFGSHLKTSDYVGSGIRVVRLENIGVLKFIEEKESFITEAKYKTLSEHTVVPGDIVFSSFITERTRVAMVPPSIDKAVNKADCFCVRCHGTVLMNRYATVLLSTRSAFKQLEAAVHGVGRPRINTTQLKELFIPVCSPAEQQAVMNQVDAQFSEIDALEADIDLNLQKAEALRQSILKKAFAGELVPQDPADEPAAALLARIRAEREAQPVNRRTRR